LKSTILCDSLIPEASSISVNSHSLTRLDPVILQSIFVTLSLYVLVDLGDTYSLTRLRLSAFSL
jgi:hypothetical protein